MIQAICLHLCSFQDTEPKNQALFSFLRPRNKFLSLCRTKPAKRENHIDSDWKKDKQENMSEKLLYSLSDENPDLSKHIGCMNGLIKVFYRQHIPKRSQKKLPPGKAEDHGREPSSELQKTAERSSKKGAKEKQRVSTESSSRAASFSSSTPRSSSFSSADISITSQISEQPALSQRNFNGTPVGESNKFQSNASPQWSRQTSFDLREVIKDSIHRETKALLVKTTTKENDYGNSLRPLLHQGKSAKIRVSLLKESFHTSARNSNEGRDGVLAAAPKDSPRLSYDEIELRNQQRCALKMKELPRLSLDSRVRSIRNSTAGLNSNSSNADTNGLQEPGSHRRTSSVVARLMGLEIPSESTSTECSKIGQINTFVTVDTGSTPRSEITINGNRPNLFCDSPRPFMKEMASPRSKNPNLMKKSPSSKFPMEPAPWKQVEGGKSQVSAKKGQTERTNSAPSVYGEIQKRLAQLEFKQSGKDLRALKQILEAMEKTQQVLDIRKDDVPSSASVTTKCSDLVPESNKPIPESVVGMKNFRSSIVIMKPAQVFETKFDSVSAIRPGLHRIQVNAISSQKDTARKLTAMDLTPRPNLFKGHLQPMDKNTNARLHRSKQNPRETCTVKTEISKTGKSQNTMSPRSQQKKLGSEKNSRPTTPSSDSRTAQRQPGRQKESVSPRRKHDTSSKNLQQTDDRLSDISCQSDARSLRSESNTSSTINADVEVTSKFRSDRIRGSLEQQTTKQKNPDIGYNPDRMTPEPVKITTEQPSPVSVLDAMFYGDESPSPVRKISTAFKDHILGFEEADWIHEDANYQSIFRKLHISSETLDKYSIDETAKPCDVKINLDHKYISEILLTSGLLRDLEYSMTIVQLNQSRLPINPDLFFVLEQRKTGKDVLQDKQRKKRIGQVAPAESVRRKLLFDTINEVLAQNFLSEGSSMPCIRSSMTMDKRFTEHQLLETLCSEIDRLEANNSKCAFDDEENLIWEDLKNQGMGWTTFQGEVPGMVLDIERLIFKDLINEVVTSEVKAIWERPGGYHRQLFTD